MKSFNVPFTDCQGMALLQIMDIALKAEGERVVDAYMELRNLIRSSAKAALDAEKAILPGVEGE